MPDTTEHEKPSEERPADVNVLGAMSIVVGLFPSGLLLWGLYFPPESMATWEPSVGLIHAWVVAMWLAILGGVFGLFGLLLRPRWQAWGGLFLSVGIPAILWMVH